MIDLINQVAWVAANILLGYTSIALLVFVVLYYTLFDPRATTGGTLIFRFMLSLVGVIGIVFIGMYFDPSSDSLEFSYPNDVEVWRPGLRLIVYGYVAFTITSLAVLLVKRKWFPNRVKTAPPQDLIKVRHETGPNPTVENKENH